MSFPNTTIPWQTRYTLANLPWACVGGQIEYKNNLAEVTDSESIGGIKRKRGTFEAEITIRGNLAADVSPFAVPQSISPGDATPEIKVFVNGIAAAPAIFRNVVCDYFREVLPDVPTNQPNTWEFHGFTSDFSAA